MSKYIVQSRYEYVGGPRDGVERYYEVSECEVLREPTEKLNKYRVRTLTPPVMAFYVLPSEVFDDKEDAIEQAEFLSDVYEATWHVPMRRPWRDEG